MTTAALHLSTAIPAPTDTRSMSLLILAGLIALVIGAIRWMARRTRIIMVISGTSALVVVLVLLAVAYVIVFAKA
ncbi:MAG TPA: hypothetical protein VFV66_32785 [Nonomuraea sp.]|nr:hypothetical protein [Nonomuraea sp.]